MEVQLIGGWANIKVASVRIYDKVLTPEQIKQNMNADRIRPNNRDASINDDKVTLSLIFDEEIKGLEANDFEVMNGTIGQLSGSGSIYTLPITEIKGTNYLTVSLKVGSYTDLAGNSGPAVSTTRYRDITGPSPTITEDTTNKTQTIYTITFHEKTTGFDINDITITGGTKGTFTRVSSNQFKLQVQNGGVSNQTINIKANACYDIAGNASIAGSKAVNIPSITITYNYNYSGSPANIVEQKYYGGTLGSLPDARKSGLHI